MFNIRIALSWMLHSLLVYQTFYLQGEPIVAIMVVCEVMSLFMRFGNTPGS